jgi:predicted aminopeptidase
MRRVQRRPADGSAGSLGTVAGGGAVCLGTGCSTLGTTRRRSAAISTCCSGAPGGRVGGRPATPAALRERLLLTQRMREFAVQELKLPDNASYRRFADLQRGRGVERGGRARAVADAQDLVLPGDGLRGLPRLLHRAEADALAAQLRAEGWEVSVYGVPGLQHAGLDQLAGRRPAAEHLRHWPEGELARLIFHELAHQVVYVPDDTMFNESFATAVERIGGRRWLQQQGRRRARAAYAAARRKPAATSASSRGRYRRRLDRAVRSGAA